MVENAPETRPDETEPATPGITVEVLATFDAEEFCDMLSDPAIAEFLEGKP